MAGDDDFDPWLGRVAHDRSFAGDLRRANLAGGVKRGSGASRFTGARIGRGSAVGRLLTSRDRFAGAQSRRAIVKARFVKPTSADPSPMS